MTHRAHATRTTSSPNASGRYNASSTSRQRPCHPTAHPDHRKASQGVIRMLMSRLFWLRCEHDVGGNGPCLFLRVYVFDGKRIESENKNPSRKGIYLLIALGVFFSGPCPPSGRVEQLVHSFGFICDAV